MHAPDHVHTPTHTPDCSKAVCRKQALAPPSPSYVSAQRYACIVCVSRHGDSFTSTRHNIYSKTLQHAWSGYGHRKLTYMRGACMWTCSHPCVSIHPHRHTNAGRVSLFLGSLFCYRRTHYFLDAATVLHRPDLCFSAVHRSCSGRAAQAICALVLCSKVDTQGGAAIVCRQ